MRLVGPVPPVDEAVFGKGQPQWTCANWNAAELLALSAYGQTVKDGSFSGACQKLNGWQVAILPTARFMRFGVSMAGVTDCSVGGTSIGARPPTQSALTHEIGHIAQRCLPSVRCADDTDCAHAGWDESGLFAAEVMTLAEGKLSNAPLGISFEASSALVP